MGEEFHYSNLTFETDPNKTDLNAFFGLAETKLPPMQHDTPRRTQPPIATTTTTTTSQPRPRQRYAGFDDSQTSFEDMLRRQVTPTTTTTTFSHRQNVVHVQTGPFPPLRVPVAITPPPPPPHNHYFPPPPPTPRLSPNSPPSPPSAPAITRGDVLTNFIASQQQQQQQQQRAMQASSTAAPSFTLSNLLSSQQQQQHVSQSIQGRWGANNSSTSTFKAPRLQPEAPAIAPPPPPPGKLSASNFFHHPDKGENFATAPTPALGAFAASDCFQVPSPLVHSEMMPAMIPGPASFYDEHVAAAPQQQHDEDEDEGEEDISAEQERQLRHERYFRADRYNSAWNTCKRMYASANTKLDAQQQRLDTLLCVICKMSFFDQHYAVALLADEHGSVMEAEIAPNAHFDMNWKEGTALALCNVAICRPHLANATAIITGANVDRIFTPNGEVITSSQKQDLSLSQPSPPMPPPPPQPEQLQEEPSLLQQLSHTATSSASTTNAFQRNLRAMEAEENWEELAAIWGQTPTAPPPQQQQPKGNDLSWLDD